MFEIKNFHKDVFVDGNILFNTDKEISFTNIEAYTNKTKEECDEIIYSNIVIDDNEGSRSFINNDQICDDNAYYHVKGEVTTYGDEDVRVNPYHCIYSYNLNLLELKEIFELDIDSMKRRVVNRMLYLSILSNYEFFMSDIFVACFLRFVNINNNIRNRYKNEADVEIVYSLRKRYYSDFKKIPKLFKDVFDVDLPDWSYLDDAFDRRNDIAHRYNRSLKNNDYVIVENEEVDELARESNKFVYEIFDRIKRVVY